MLQQRGLGGIQPVGQCGKGGEFQVGLQLRIAPHLSIAIQPATTQACAHGAGHIHFRMVADVQDAFDGGLARAQVIARTETIDAYRAGAKAHHEANSDVLQGWVWLAKLSERTCPSCVVMHGTEHDLNEPGPLDHQQGRCSRMPLVKPELVPGTPTPKVESGPEWLARQPEGVQRSVLGPRRYEAWKAGDYPASRWAVRRESAAWRPSYGPGPISG